MTSIPKVTASLVHDELGMNPSRLGLITTRGSIQTSSKHISATDFRSGNTGVEMLWRRTEVRENVLGSVCCGTGLDIVNCWCDAAVAGSGRRIGSSRGGISMPGEPRSTRRG